MNSRLRGPSLAVPPLRRRWLVAIALWLAALCAVTGSAAERAAGTGYLDQVRYAAKTRELFVAGWAAPEQANVFTSAVTVRLGDREIYRGRLLRHERPDVVTATGRQDWLWSGWQVRVTLPRAFPAGTHAVSARIRLTDGAEFDLPVIAANAKLAIEEVGARAPITALIALGLAVLLPLLAFVGPALPATTRRANGRGGAPAASAMFGVALALSFALLVGAGITGSSLDYGLSASPVTRDDSIPLLGRPQQIRSDEWLLTTPMAIAQAAHDPPFPVVNRNIGPEGQNMLVVGMTGMPVQHVSALARPATWGLLLFDLRRGLAWYWWFPFFACFAGLWLLLTRLFELEWRLAAALSLTVSASPYAIGWSGWPAYTAAFPLLGLVAADVALRARQLWPSLASGALLGLCLAGFVLVLYPAWQVALGYLLLPVAAALFVRHRRQYRFGIAQMLAAVAAAAVAALLLAAWWQAAQEAVTAISGTVYPGQRSTTTGGDAEPWILVKGLLTPLTLYQSSALLNQSDAASFIYLLPALAVGTLVALWRRRYLDPLATAIVAFIALALVYLFHGFDPGFARYSLWGHSVPFRVDLALGLAQTLLIAWLIAPPRDQPPTWLAGLLGSAASVALAVHLLSGLPADLAAQVPPGYVVLACLALGVAAYLLLAGRREAFVALYASWTIGAGLAFNPLSVAPTSVAPLADYWRDDAAQTGQGIGRVAVVGEQDLAMTLLAAGIPVLNGVFYYPQPAVWRPLDPQGEQRVLYNRHHRLMLSLATLPADATHRIDSPRLDEVRLTLDPARFDFRLLDARWVLSSTRDADALAANPTVERLAERGGWVLQRVRR